MFTSTTLSPMAEPGRSCSGGQEPGDQDATRRHAASAALEPPWRSVPRSAAACPAPAAQPGRSWRLPSRSSRPTAATLTMRRVADQIGVSASALYGYVANKEELVQLVLEQIITEIPLPAAAGGWPDTMRTFAREMLGAFRRHPGVAARSPSGACRSAPACCPEPSTCSGYTARGRAAGPGGRVRR